MTSLLFFDQFNLKTGLSPDEVKKRLQEKCDGSKTAMFMATPDSVGRSLSGKPYAGKVDAVGFEMFRIPEAQTSFIPVIYGAYDQYLGKTEVKVTMKLHKFSGILLLFIVLLAGVVTGVQFYLHGFDLTLVQWIMRIIPVVVIPAVVINAIVAFKKESKRTYDFLVELLAAEKL